MLQPSRSAATAEELESFYQDLKPNSLGALWTVQERALVDEPKSQAQAHLWPWRELRPRAMKAAALVGTQDAERRVLMLLNPGLDGRIATTNSLFSGIQIVMPGEAARAHRHTPAALRFIIESAGGYTTVEGDKVPMRPGDLVLTPNWTWHDHGNETSKPMIWLDCLDAPLVGYLDAMLQEPFYENPQPVTLPVGYTNSRIGGGLMRGIQDNAVSKPLPITYKWPDAYGALGESGAETPFDGVAMEYINPLNGGHTMPTISCRLQQIRPDEHTGTHRHTGNTVYHAAAGKGFSVINGTRVDWEKGDTFVLPPLAWHEHGNESPQDAVLFSMSDAPVLEALQLYREEEGSRQEVVGVLD